MSGPRRTPTRPPATVPAAGAYDGRPKARAPRAARFEASTVSLEPGISLVEASAGTGKTHSITQLVLRLLLDRNADGAYRVGGIGNILVVTFGKAATDELITRVRAALREAADVFGGVITETAGREGLFALRDQYGASEGHRFREALASLDRLSIFTIHGWSKRVLEENALESGTPFGAQFIEESDLIVQRITQDWWRRTMYKDEQLAAIAVQQEWTHDAFLKDLATWQRLPNTPMDPSDDLVAARKLLILALAQFPKLWDLAATREFLDSLTWRKNAPLGDPATRARVLEAGAALATGDLVKGMPFVMQCTAEAIRDGETGIMSASRQKPKTLFDAVSEQPFVKGCDRIFEALEGMGLALRVSCLLEVHHRLDEEKRRRHLLGFDDLLRRLKTAIEEGGSDGQLATAIRSRYDVALIDEFQDTDPFQFPIFSTAFAGRPLFLIGDPKQAIYGFRGADLFSYMDAVDKAQHHYTLGSNWRSTPAMIGAVNALFAHRCDAFLYGRIRFDPVAPANRIAASITDDGRGAMHWWTMPPEIGTSGLCQITKTEAARRVHGALAREVVRLLTDTSSTGGPLRPHQIAVLVRTGFEGLAVQEVLRAAGVPSIVSGLGDILESAEMMELEGLLRAVLVPTDSGRVRAALSTELWGLDAAAIHRLSDPDHESEWQTLIDRCVVWRERWMRQGFMRMIQGTLGELQAAQRLLAHEDGERRLTNLRHAIELLHGAVSEERLSPDGLLLWISATRASGEAKAERTELRLETDADAVRISTIHKSKGLEYDVVFCPGLWSSWQPAADAPILVHLDESAGSAVFDHGSPEYAERRRLAVAEQLAEELRLVYVALTRARLRCYVAWGAVMNKGKGTHAGHSALGYLLRPTDVVGHPPDVAELVPARFAASLTEWDAPLRELVARSAGGMTIEKLGAQDQTAPPFWSKVSDAVVAPVCRSDLPALETLQSWRVASFTSLTADKHVEEVRDVADGAHAERAPMPVLAATDFMAFASGRHAGIALHELFELVDFAAAAPELRAVTTQVLDRFHLRDCNERIDAVTSMAARVLGDRLPETTFALREVPRARTLREWKFHLPLGVVQRNTFADAFVRHGGELARRYVPALRALSADRTTGFLTGVVDLVFQQDERWYVVDWKSNHLGLNPASYESSALEPEMFGSHYVLQYHLYITALHRFLRVRLPGYDYDRHIGGAWYAFIRGIDGSGRGWFHDRPPRSLIDALDRLMDAPATTAEATT